MSNGSRPGLEPTAPGQMCGGEHAVNYLPDTYRFLVVWTWEPTGPRSPTTTGRPRPSTFPASAVANQVVYDPIRQRVVMQGGQGIAANTAANVTYLYGTTVYNGSPTNYTSEFDCLTNSWSIYASPTTGTPIPNDPVLAGVTRNSQIAEMDFDFSLNWVGLYTSNNLTITVGAL